MFDVNLFRSVLAEEVEKAVRREFDRRFGTARLSKTELAASLKRTTATIDRHVRDGMPFEREGNHRRFDLDACKAWLKDRPSSQGQQGRLEQGVERRSRRRYGS